MNFEAPALQLDSDGTARREDKYSRSELAGRIAEALVRAAPDESLVLALEGPWGSGKSWLIERVTEELKSGRAGAKARVVHFNPWLIGEESNLILDFLVQIGLEIDSSANNVAAAKTAATSLLGYAKALGHGRYLKYVPVPILKDAGEILAEAHEKLSEHLETAQESLEGDGKKMPSLTDARKTARAAVSGLEQRLVVVIDDIDRLRSREIRAVMQLVKAVADFPNTSFLLSMDAEAVARALAEDSDVTVGRRYLEKIVQLSISVPPIDRGDSLKDIESRFRTVTSAVRHETKPFENQLLENALSAVARLCSTPRDVVRWANHVGWSARGLAGSINIADLCVAEALQIRLGTSKWHQILSSLGCDEDESANYQNADPWAHGDPTKHSRRQEALEKIATEFESRFELRALRWLFPEFEKNGDKSPSDSLRNRRLAALPVRQHYRRFRANRDDVSGSDLDNWLMNPSEFDKALGNDRPTFEYHDLQRLFAISQRLNPKTIPHQIEKLQPLLNAISRYSASEFGNSAAPDTSIAVIASEVFMALESSDIEVRSRVQDGLGLPEAVYLLDWLGHRVGDRLYQDEGRQASAEKARDFLTPLVLSRLRTAVEARSLLSERARIYMLYALSRIGSLTEAGKAVEGIAGKTRDLEALLEQVAALPAEHWNMSAVPLIDLVPDPKALIDSINALDDSVYGTLKRAYMHVSAKQLDDLAAKFRRTSAMEQLLIAKQTQRQNTRRLAATKSGSAFSRQAKA